MDLKTWQTNVRDRLTAAGDILRESGPGMVYGALSALSILPLVSAVNQGDLAAVGLLYNMVSSVGTSLIANQLQSWKDHSEEELATELAQQAAAQPDLRDALDKLQAGLETPRLAQAILSEADWDRLTALRQADFEQFAALVQQELQAAESGVNVRVIQPSLVEWLKADRKQVRSLLNRLAFEAHHKQPAEQTGTADLAEKDLVYGLFELRRSQEVNEQKLIEYLSERAGLLAPRGVKVYTFPHRTFQEYLAACHLTDLNYPETVASLARIDPNRWREVALLAGAKATGGAASNIWELAEALCLREPDSPDYTRDDAWGAHLAGQALAESANLTQITPRNQPKLERVRRGLLHILLQSDLPATERAEAGRTLAKLGDPRPVVLTTAGMEFCYVPAGPFIMGSREEEDDLAQSDEQPQHTFDIPYAYWISRYPVTNAQFSEFVEAGGYANPVWWVEAREQSYWSSEGFKGYSDKEPRQQPYNFGEPFTLSNHPVVGVSWYEALAFTRWLTEQWASPQPPYTGARGWQVQLPSEAEWEKAARGGLEIPSESVVAAHTTMMGQTAPSVILMENPLPKRRYAWGYEIETKRMNFSQTNINSTSAVGCFPGGVSVYGAEEMNGNVWEWCRTKWVNNYDDYANRAKEDWSGRTGRVWRGGSFPPREPRPLRLSRLLRPRHPLRLLRFSRLSPPALSLCL